MSSFPGLPRGGVIITIRIDPSRREDLHTEFKRDWSDRYLRNIAAFANTDGGVLCIGLDDDGTPVGLDEIDHVLKVIPDKISAALGISPTVEVREKDGVEYIAIETDAYEDPVFLDGRIWVRSGSTTRMIQGQELRRFLLRASETSWTEYPAEGCTFDDLNPAAVSAFRSRAKDFGQLNDKELKLDSAVLLDKMYLSNGGRPTRAAEILFGSEPTRISPGACITIVRMEGSKVLYYHDLTGPMYMMVDAAMDLIRTQYTVSPVTYEGILRRDNHPYPLDAVREALLNAIINSDYSRGIPIKIEVASDHLDVLNPGDIPYGRSLEEIIDCHLSEPRSIGMAAAFRRAAYVERFGRGFSMMIDAYEGTGVDPPRFESLGGMFLVRFRNIVADRGIVPRDFYGREIRDSSIDESDSRLLSELSSNPHITVRELASKIGVTERQAYRRLSSLTSKGMIRREGGKKNGVWVVDSRIEHHRSDIRETDAMSG